eukprot:m.33853 g.33853  ORF g.33853 m.33853 type:complete len:432 (-) comp8614_c0_seq2:121-1416(-)
MGVPASRWTDWHLQQNIYHGRVHISIGGFPSVKPGTMSRTSTASNDPVFFMHHGNVDRIWSLWQAKGNGRATKCDDPNEALAGTSHKFKDFFDLSKMPGDVCVEYALTSKAPSKRPRFSKRPKRSDEIAANAIEAILFDIDESFFDPSSPYWLIPTLNTPSLSVDVEWAQQMHPNLTKSEVEALLTQGNEYRYNQPQLELDELPYLDVLDPADKILGAERVLTLAMGISASGFRTALNTFDISGVLRNLYDTEFNGFVSNGCIFRGDFFADGDPLPATSSDLSASCASMCTCSAGAITCEMPDKTSTWYQNNCCCDLNTADCLSCKAGENVSSYCEASPTTPGCPKPDCCTAATARCQSCLLGITEEQLCEHLPMVIGCSAQEMTSCEVIEEAKNTTLKELNSQNERLSFYNCTSGICQCPAKRGYRLYED